MSLTDMIVRPRFGPDSEIFRYTVIKGSRSFAVLRGSRGDWETYDRDALLAVPDDQQMFDVVPCLDVSGDLSGSLEYIEGLFR